MPSATTARGRLFGNTSTATASTCTKTSTLSPTSNSKTKNLQLAAEALAEAARLVAAASPEVDPVTQNREALMCYFETELDALTKSIKASKENFNAKINSVNQKIAHLCLATEKTNTLLESQAKVKSLATEKTNTLLESQAKVRRLELAITYAYIGSFSYQDPSHNSKKNSSDEVKRILHHFVLGLGCDLPADHFVGSSIWIHCNMDSKSKIEAQCRNNEMQVLFRKKIIQQIKDLIGQEPRLVDDGDRKFTILPPL
jgi:hypothetical protein